MKKNLPADIIAALFILLFSYTAINKYVAMDTLKYVLSEYPLIGKQFAPIIAWGLPIVEIIVVVLLFMPRTRLLGLYSSLLLMTAFTLYLIYMLAFTDKRGCTCGGYASEIKLVTTFVL
ncbi:MAG: MauE/DoxX family redox-associated membrane protein [Bacteroidota bacterium]